MRPRPMHPPRFITAAAASALALLLAACGGSAGPPSSTGTSAPPPSAAPAPAAPPAGCQQASLVAAAVRDHLTALSRRQLTALEHSLPSGKLKSDVELAIVDLSFYREYTLMGGPVRKAARAFRADAMKIEADCSSA